MKCPACVHELTEEEVGGIKLDVCKGGCGGVWFDAFELQKFDEKHEAEGLNLDFEPDPNLVVDHEAKRSCPKCADTHLMRHFYSPKKRVEVDECPGCGGFWLDTGELAQIHEMFETSEERAKETEKMVNEVTKTVFAQMRAEREAKLEKCHKIAKMFRFVCPSYYIPGKQEWGAF
jgi:uncharacterized protein